MPSATTSTSKPRPGQPHPQDYTHITIDGASSVCGLGRNQAPMRKQSDPVPGPDDPPECYECKEKVQRAKEAQLKVGLEILE